jgi:uncharacterized membrane protein YdfJ with MMPL/SSD domain
MGGLGRIAQIPAGSWTKWVVAGFWVVVLVLAFPLSKKLTGAEKNDASAWLPAVAESTKVLNAQARFQSPNVYTGVVIYGQAAGITVADRARAAEPTTRGMWVRVGWSIAPRPRITWIITAVLLGVMALDARHGAIVGLAATGGVITSAGFVLAGTFAVLATIPATFLTEIGFAVAFGILLDTIVVRSVLVTALNLDLGRRMWWPSRLARKPDPAPGELSQERVAALMPGGPA